MQDTVAALLATFVLEKQPAFPRTSDLHSGFRRQLFGIAVANTVVAAGSGNRREYGN